MSGSKPTSQFPPCRTRMCYSMTTVSSENEAQSTQPPNHEYPVTVQRTNGPAIELPIYVVNRDEHAAAMQYNANNAWFAAHGLANDASPLRGFAVEPPRPNALPNEPRRLVLQDEKSIQNDLIFLKIAATKPGLPINGLGVLIIQTAALNIVLHFDHPTFQDIRRLVVRPDEDEKSQEEVDPETLFYSFDIRQREEAQRRVDYEKNRWIDYLKTRPEVNSFINDILNPAVLDYLGIMMICREQSIHDHDLGFFLERLRGVGAANHRPGELPNLVTIAKQGQLMAEEMAELLLQRTNDISSFIQRPNGIINGNRRRQALSDDGSVAAPLPKIIRR